MKNPRLFFVVSVFIVCSCKENFQPLTITNNSSFDVQFNMSTGGIEQESFSIPQATMITLDLNMYGPVVDSSITPKTVRYLVEGFTITFLDKTSIPMEIENSTAEPVVLVETRGIMVPPRVEIPARETNTTAKIYGENPDFRVEENSRPVQITKKKTEEVLQVVISD